MKNNNTRSTAILIAAASAVAAVACSLVLPFDDLGNGVRGDEGGTSNESGSGDGSSPSDAGADGDSDVPILDNTDAAFNPAAGDGIFGLHLTKQASDGGLGATPVRLDHGDAGVLDIGCRRPSILNDTFWRQAVYYGTTTHYDKVDPTKAQFIYPVLNSDAPDSFQYFIATETTKCTPGSAGNLPTDPLLRFTGNGLAPAFSNDGTRFALITAPPGDKSGLGHRVITMPTSGAADEWPLRDIVNWKDAFVTITRPAWFSDNQGPFVIWAELTPKLETVVRFARDQVLTLPTNPADPDTYPELMRCSSTDGSIRQLALMQFGGHLVLGFSLAGKTPPSDAGIVFGATDIYLSTYPPNCANRTRLFNDSPSSESNDFAISPDGVYLAHQSNRGENDPAKADRPRIWVGTANGKRQVCSHPDDSHRDIGPVWLSGGAQIAWTRIGTEQKSADGDIIIASFVNGVCTEQLKTDAKPDAFLSSRSGTCSVTSAIGRASPTLFGSGFLIAVAAVLAFVRRNLRRVPRPSST